MMRVVISLGAPKDFPSLVSSNLRISLFLYLYMLFASCYVKYGRGRYGDMPAHNLLWSHCQKSSDNVAARLAVIPLVQVISLFSYLYVESLFH